MASSAQCICLLFILSLQVVAFPVINERAIHQLNKVSDSDGRDRNLDGRSTLAIFAGNLAPSSSLSLRVRDSEGQDAFDTLTTYHYRHNVSSRVNRKRDVALPIITCPPGQNYYGSNCVRALNAQAYSISCGYRSGQHGFVFTDNPGSCHNDEICIEVENTLWIREAYCVGRINFVSFIRTQNGQSLRDISAGLHPVTNAVTSVEAVMTATDKKSVISTSSLQISAQSAVKINNVQSWGSLAGGVVQCSHCSSVQLSPVPPATQRIVTNVQLEAGMASGILWLAEVIH